MSLPKNLIEQIQSVGMNSNTVKAKCREFVDKQSVAFSELLEKIEKKEAKSEITPDVVASQPTLQDFIGENRGPQIHQALVSLVRREAEYIRARLPVTSGDKTTPTYCYFNIEKLSPKAISLLKQAIPQRTLKQDDIISREKINDS